MTVYRVTFVDWRYGKREMNYSPCYENIEDCKKFIKKMREMSNAGDFTELAIRKFSAKNFEEADLERFKRDDFWW